MKHARKYDYIYTYRKVKRKGKIDGRGFKWKFWPFVKAEHEVRPSMDQTDYAQFEKELFKVGQQELRTLSEDWEQLDTKLKTNYCVAKSIYNKALKSKEKETDEAIREKESFTRVSKEYSDLGRPAISSTWTLFWLFFFGAAEFPLNSIVFQVIGENFWLTMIMAAGLCFAIPWSAHFFGKAIKQEEKSKSDKILIVITPIIILALLAGIAIVRTVFFEAAQSNFKWLHLDISPTTLAVLFIIINLTIFFVSVLVSYQGSHKKHDLYKSMCRRYKNALKSLKKETTEADIANANYAKAVDTYHAMKTQREGCHNSYTERAKFIIVKLGTYMEVYRGHNIEARKSAGIPLCFKLDLMKLDIPENLLHENLNWDCPDDIQNNEAAHSPNSN